MTSKTIIHDQEILSRPSIQATKEDLIVAQDLKDTLLANKDSAIGLAANMIGVNKRIIAVFVGPFPMVMINPIIINSQKEYIIQEGCLSLSGMRTVKRFKKIRVKYMDETLQQRVQIFEELIAEAIQHEIDHCEGILI